MTTACRECDDERIITMLHPIWTRVGTNPFATAKWRLDFRHAGTRKCPYCR